MYRDRSVIHTRNSGEIDLCIVLIASYIVEGAVVNLHVGGVVEHGERRARCHVVGLVVNVVNVQQLLCTRVTSDSLTLD